MKNQKTALNEAETLDKQGKVPYNVECLSAGLVHR